MAVMYLIVRAKHVTNKGKAALKPIGLARADP